MGDPGSSDTLKKMVLSNIHSIKKEHADDVGPAVITGCSDLDCQQTQYGNVKSESLESSGHHIYNWQTDQSSATSEPDSDLLSVTKKGKYESSEERASRLAKMSAYAAQRLANESPEQRASRLKRMSDYAARRLASETSEQRAKRLARMSAYAAKRLAQETPEQRQARLTRMSAYAARRQSSKLAMKKMTGAATTFSQSNDNFNDMITRHSPNQS